LVGEHLENRNQPRWGLVKKRKSAIGSSPAVASIQKQVR
jgi:hypothetical protein